MVNSMLAVVHCILEISKRVEEWILSVLNLQKKIQNVFMEGWWWMCLM